MISQFQVFWFPLYAELSQVSNYSHEVLIHCERLDLLLYKRSIFKGVGDFTLFLLPGVLATYFISSSQNYALFDPPLDRTVPTHHIHSNYMYLKHAKTQTKLRYFC